MKPHKFTPGKKIRTVAHFARLMAAGRWIYYRRKPTHPGWAVSWPFRSVQDSIARGWLREATEVKP